MRDPIAGDAPPVLVVPGWTGSGPEHWQTLWEASHPGFRRVAQRDWDHPDRAEWVGALAREVNADAKAPILVAHSLGCLVVAHWSAAHPYGRVRGALLVAPPDVEREDTPPALRGFAPVPRRPLPFAAIVVASRNDPYADYEASRELAMSWGADLADAGNAGHLNSASKLGEWEAGQALLARLIAATR